MAVRKKARAQAQAKPQAAPQAAPKTGEAKGQTEGAADNEVQVLIAYFEDSEEATMSARRFAERDRDYYDNKQLTQAELDLLKQRGQPDVIINRIKMKVDYLLGYEAAQRTDPRGYPRTPQDEDAAEACTDSLRYVRDKVYLPQIFSQAWENMIIEGFCGAEFGVEPTGEGDADITGKAIHWDRLFADPHSREHDYTDARYVGQVVWMDRVEAEMRWPDGEAKDSIARSIGASEIGDTYDDKPSRVAWIDSSGTRRRVRICQIYYKRGDTWHWCIFTKGGKLAEGEVPYRNHDGKSLCPLILQSAYIDRDANRYGFVRTLIGPQDEINKRRSKSLHLLMGKPFKYEEGAVDDINETKKELARANGGVKVNPGFEFEFLDNSQELQGHLGLMQEAKDEIELAGPNAAMQGKGERSASGRAIIAQQQGGQIEMYKLTDRHNHFKRRCYELIWAMIQQYWTAEKWIRVTDDERNTRFVGLSRPVIAAEKLVKDQMAKGMPEDEAKAQIAQAVQNDPTGQMREQLQQVVTYENTPAEMAMDIILEEVPDTANLMQEQFEIMTKLAPAVVFPAEMYIEMSALRNKNELLEKLEKAKEDPVAKQEAEDAAKMRQLELAEMQQKIEKMSVEVARLTRSGMQDAADLEKTRADIYDKRADTAKKMVETDMLDAQLGQIMLPSVYGQWPAENPQAAPAGFGGMGVPGEGFPAAGGPPAGPGSRFGGLDMMPPGAMPPGMTAGMGQDPGARFGGLDMEDPTGGLLPLDGMEGGPNPFEAPTGPGPGFPPGFDPSMPVDGPQFNPLEMQNQPTGAGGY